MISSLENLCRVPALVQILNCPHLKKEIFRLPINRLNFKERDVTLQRAVSEAMKDFHHVLKSSTPKHLIVFIGIEMWNWAEHQKQYFELSFKFSENFIRSSFFTSKGLIDEEEAARKLLMEPGLSDFLRYSIACQYFLEDVIPNLWQTLQKNERNFRKMLKEHKSRVPAILWSNYVKKKNSASILNQNVLTRRFKIRVFSYGLKHNNIGAVKFSFSSKGRSRNDKTEAKIIRKLVYKRFCEYVSPILDNLLNYRISGDCLFRTKFLADQNIILCFISLMSKAELKNFFLKFVNSFTIFKLFLLWPYQNYFMNFAHIIYDNFGVWEFKELMTQIIRLSDDQYVCDSYNYRLLLREFWIKSPPHLKKEIISLESEENVEVKLIEMFFELRNFKSDDLANVNLILENVSSVDRETILLNQGKYIFRRIIFSHGNFKLADLFLKKLDLNKETLQTFKENFILNSFLYIMKKQDMNLVDKIFKWVVGSEDIGDFKDEIFNRLINSNKTEHFFLDMEEEIPFSFLNKIIKWFLKTDEKIEEWKSNIEYSPLVRYVDFQWFDCVLQYQGRSHEEASDFKRQLIFAQLPEIARCFLNYESTSEYLVPNLYCLCLQKKEKIIEFIAHLRSFYENSIKQKMCLLCLNNNFVLGNEVAQLYCENHGTNGFVSLNLVDEICTAILKKFTYYINLNGWSLYRDQHLEFYLLD